MTDMEMIFMGTPRPTDHSPTPWELVEATEHHGPYICNVYGGDVCDLYAMSNPLMPSTASGGISRPVSFVDADANAAFIVKAANSHDALVKALTDALCELTACAKQLKYRPEGSVDRAIGAARHILGVVSRGEQP